ncbi:HEAT repeat-containing protein 6-like [Anneissia japonica]|uniref:HEAT repeat-containing protein 6-like n=1 Tax=Anneissia japonica TaxID=1529436 RepID=UPI001425BA5D|nr:HEAT repeat-containing protein 6-like [Anneissia japonica]
METAISREEQQRFSCCLIKLQSLVPTTDESFKSDVNSTLDTLNSINYSHCSIPDKDVNETLCRLCVLVPLGQDLLVAKACQLVVFVAHLKNTLTPHTIETVVEYVIEVIRRSPEWMKHDVLRALGALLYENGPTCLKFIDELLFDQPKGLLITLLESPDTEVKRLVLHCIGNLCMQDSDNKAIDESYLRKCLNILLQVLKTQKEPKTDELEYCRILYGALRGIQVILTSNKKIQLERLGDILATAKVYMLFGLPGISGPVPSTLYPSPYFQSEPTPPSPSSSQQKKEEVKDEVCLRPGGRGGGGLRSSALQSGKKTKKKSRAKQESTTASRVDVSPGTSRPSASNDHMSSKDEPDQLVTNGASSLHPGFISSSINSAVSLMPLWSRVSSSESEYSDTEGGQSSRLRSMMSKVRQTSLLCLHSVMKNTEKRIVFGYWSAFIPDSPPRPGSSSHTLFTSILKDSSPKARVAGVVVLSAMLEGSRNFLAAADDREIRHAAFTPFSRILAMSIKEIHRSLLLALVAETSSMTITQIIKCLSILVQNVPYKKLKEGLLTRIVRTIRPFFSNKDNNIRTACLTCLGSIIAAANPPLPEVSLLLQAKEMPTSTGSGTIPNMAAAAAVIAPECDNIAVSNSDASHTESSGFVQESHLNGGQRLTVQDSTVSSQSETSDRLPWVIRFCRGIIIPSTNSDCTGLINRLQLTPTSAAVGEVLPVKLEALQVLVQLAKNYFAVVRPVLQSISHIIVSCIDDPDPSMQLHGLKVLEEFGKALLYQLNPDSSVGGRLQAIHPPINVDEVVTLWLSLLNGPLPVILQHPRTLVLQAFACDCLSTIGPCAFELLPLDKRILCVTLLLGLSNDEDHRVKASAIRALGVYILYPCLREDVMFVADSANAVLSALEDSFINVRMKAAWSLGNLSDALIINKQNDDSVFIEEFSDLLLQRLFEAAIKGSTDHDKVKSNSVRGLGNLIRFINRQTLAKGNFPSLVDRTMYALIKNIRSGAMKVRWNACYAISNAFKNSHLDIGSASWTNDLYKAISNIILDCKNFKVRINGALALCSPMTRHCYGNQKQFTDLVTCVVEGLEKSGKVEAASELKYRETLTHQLCQTLCHLCSFLQIDDIRVLEQVWKANEVSLETFMCKYKKSIQIPEGNDIKGAYIQRAQNHLDGLLESCPADASHRSSIQWLNKQFSTEDEPANYPLENELACN